MILESTTADSLFLSVRCVLFVYYGRHYGVAVLLLERGANSEEEDREDLTALHWAARMGKHRVALALLDHKADVEVIFVLARYSWRRIPRLPAARPLIPHPAISVAPWAPSPLY